MCSPALVFVRPCESRVPVANSLVPVGNADMIMQGVHYSEEKADPVFCKKIIEHKTFKSGTALFQSVTLLFGESQTR